MSFSSPLVSSSSNRSPRIPSPPPSLPSLFPGISSLSPLAPLMNSTAINNNNIFDISNINNNNTNNNNNNRTSPLPAPVFLDLQTEINRSVSAMPYISSQNNYENNNYYNSNNNNLLLSNQKINTKTDLFAGSPLLQESIIDAPAIPSYYDKMSSFYSTMSSSRDILLSLDQLFQDNNIDYERRDDKKQFKALSYINQHPIHFRVYIYWKDSSKYLIEFQKRDGCCFAYRQLYKSLIEQMSDLLCTEQCVKNNINNNNSTSGGLLSLERLSLNDSRTQTFNHCSSLMINNNNNGNSMSLSFFDSDSLSILLSMAQADCIQSQREALRALSASSAINGEQASLIISDKESLIIKLFTIINNIIMNEQDQELIRCALTFFNNLLDKSSIIRLKLFDNRFIDAQRFIDKIILLLDGPIDELTMEEIKRQCARFINIYSQSNKNDLLSYLDNRAWQMIDRYQKGGDRRVQKYLIAAKIALGH